MMIPSTGTLAKSAPISISESEVRSAISRNLPLPAGLASIGGALDVRGYAHPLPAGLTSIGGALDVRGYAHPLPSWIVDGGSDRRGFYFAGVRTSAGWRIKAGCRNFGVEEARQHWGPDGESARADCLALVEKIAAEIQRRDDSGTT